MPWVEVLAVFLVCHVVGDFLLQTDFQAVNKPGGLGKDSVRRKALFSHVFVYTLSYIPAFIWLAGDLSTLGLIGVIAGVAIPHLLQDDGRPVRWWMTKIKKADPYALALTILVDQSAHLVVLFLLALAAGQ